MGAIERIFFFNNLVTSHLHLKRNGRKCVTLLAQKRDLSENSRTQQQLTFPLRVPNTILARSVVAVFGLGFIDAG